MLFDNFEQNFVNFALEVQNAQKSAQTQINSLNILKNELVKIRKNESSEMPDIHRELAT